MWIQFLRIFPFLIEAGRYFSLEVVEFGSRARIFRFFTAKVGQGGKRGYVVSGNGPSDSSDGDRGKEEELCLAISATFPILLHSRKIRAIARSILCHSFMMIGDRGEALVPEYARLSLVFHDQLYAWRLLSLRVWRRAPPLLFEQISINSSMTVEFPSFSVGTTGRFSRKTVKFKFARF